MNVWRRRWKPFSVFLLGSVVVCEFSRRQLRHTKYLFPSFFKARFKDRIRNILTAFLTISTTRNHRNLLQHNLHHHERPDQLHAKDCLADWPPIHFSCCPHGPKETICSGTLQHLQNDVVLWEVFSMSSRRSSPLNDFTLTSSVFLALYPPIGSIQEKLQRDLPVGSGHLPLDGSLGCRRLLHCRHDA
jgi:hypothetical protein